MKNNENKTKVVIPPLIPSPQDPVICTIIADARTLGETAEVCHFLLERTKWRLRFADSNLLHKLMAEHLIPETHLHRFVDSCSRNI